MKPSSCGTTSKGDLTRQRILDTATHLVNEKGFYATSINDLLKATGLQKGSLYFHFSGKDELLMAVLERAKTKFLELFGSVLSTETPAASLNNFFKLVIELQESSGCVGGCIFGNTALEMSDQDERVTFFVKGMFNEWTEKLRKVVEAAQAAGDIRSDIAADMIARHIVATIEGGIMLARIEKNEKPLKDCLNSLKRMTGMEK